AEVAISGKRLRVPMGELVALAGKPPATSGERSGIHFRGASGGARGGATQPPPAQTTEVNLVGLTVDEALPRVDKLLDDAALAVPPGEDPVLQRPLRARGLPLLRLRRRRGRLQVPDAA